MREPICSAPTAPASFCASRSRRLGLSHTFTILALSLIGNCIIPLASAQDGPSVCLPPNPQRHPLFGTPTVRCDVEGMGTPAIQAAFGDLNGDGLLDIAIAVGAPSNSHVNVCINRG